MIVGVESRLTRQSAVAAAVTNADLVFGRLDPAFPASGRMALDHAAAEEVTGGPIAAPLGPSIPEAAAGIAGVRTPRNGCRLAPVRQAR
jgi:hypothetical protein